MDKLEQLSNPKQIKYIVKQEGNIAAVRAIPFGLMIGGGLSWLVQPEGGD